MYGELRSEKIDSQTRLINSILKKEVESINSGYCFFLGAGCSVSSGIPLASQITSILKKLVFIEYNFSLNKVVRKKEETFYQYLDRVDGHIFKYEIIFEEFIKSIEEGFLIRLDDERLMFEEQISKYFPTEEVRELAESFLNDRLYGLWFEKYSEKPRNRQAFIEEIIENIEPSGAYVLLGQLIKMGYVKNIFTTNFDDLISDALILYYGDKPRVYSHNEIAQFIQFTDKRPNIVKLHGDFLYENIKNINKETKRLDSNMEKKFSEALSNQDIIFLGYNGADESIMNVLTKVREENKFTIYWCGLDERNLHWRVVKLLNDSDDSYFIKIRDFDDFLFELFNQAPKAAEINIVQKARSNEAKMKNYLNSFYKKRFKRSHKICAEEYSIIGEIPVGYEMLQKIKEDSLPIDQIVNYYKFIAELNPNIAWVLNNYGVSLIKNGNHSDAVNIIKGAINNHPSFSLLWYNLGIIYHDTDRLEDALSAFHKASELDNSFANAFNNLAVTYNSQREYDLALAAIEKAINIQAKGKYLVNKGIFLKNKKHLKEAIKFYDAAIDKKEDLLEAYLNKGNALRLLKEYDLAVEYTFSALKINSDHEYIYANLAEIYAEKGDSDNFYFYLIEALKRNYPIWRHLDDRAFRNYKKEDQFIKLLKEYCPINL
jgi:tetratricopeptide (TPR) repeat protein